MCGITGAISLRGEPIAKPMLKRMCDAIVHRGPDDEGMLVDEFVGLGMRRLAIIDIASGKQPVHNEEQDVWIVFNGEIYNYRGLRDRLQEQGHRFYTKSDTETIVHLYEEYGDRCVEHLNGMYCFAIWDKRRKRVLLARDRVGEKTLFYTYKDGRFYFGSEIKCLLAADAVSRKIDHRALDAYLRFLYVPSPATMYEDVREVPPGHIVTLELGQEPKFSSYWQLNFAPRQDISEADAVQLVSDQLRRSVRSRLESDVPLGALLSGGIDSSAVVAAMVEASSEPVKTFTIGYGEAGRVYDERAHAKAFAKHFGTEHHEFVVEPNLIDLLPTLVRSFDQPFADSSAVANYYVFRETSRHVKVVLSGLGGDEVFAGYERHLAIRMHAMFGNLPDWIRARAMPWLAQHVPEPRSGGRWQDRIKRFARAASLPTAGAYLQYMTSFDDAARRRLYAPQLAHAVNDNYEAQRFLDVYGGAERGDAVANALRTDTLTYLPGDLLALTDRMSMAHSVEARAPLVDPDLIELAATLPSTLKLRGREKKHLLKRAVASMVPAEVLKRPKKGFTIPLTVWLRGELLPYVRSVLSREKIARTGLFNPDAVDALIDEHVALKQNHHARLWALLVFMVWYEQYEIGA